MEVPRSWDVLNSSSSIICLSQIFWQEEKVYHCKEKHHTCKELAYISHDLGSGVFQIPGSNSRLRMLWGDDVSGEFRSSGDTEFLQIGEFSLSSHGFLLIKHDPPMWWAIISFLYILLMQLHFVQSYQNHTCTAKSRLVSQGFVLYRWAKMTMKKKTSQQFLLNLLDTL